MQKTKVVNKYHGESYDVYIGRGSKWGNPFTHLDLGSTKAKYKVKTREEAVEKYREWIKTQPQLLAALPELKGKTLCCFCKPHACHGDVLAELADALPDPQPEKPESVIHIGFVGSDPANLGGYDLNKPGYAALQRDLETYIKRNLEVYHTVVGHSGLSLGGEIIWAKALLAMRKQFPGHVQFHAEIPMKEQADEWPSVSDIGFWHERIKSADFHTIYGSLAECTSSAMRRMTAKSCFEKQAKGMTSHINVLLALHDGADDDTKKTIGYAEANHVNVYRVSPRVYFNKK